ncbi:hypothetical protein [Enterococcus sp. JM9B]|uniref:hypothetical protein n=1 Tax=Enterococcus sp. JM9B TaxID=1857216 RepID=UPI001374A758|nr:hypothetical protein [Enterococcus sp. JM9B]KAF1303688.1 hypothetical protein BAU16_03740 [Enterococcus sp. JM9B]
MNKQELIDELTKTQEKFYEVWMNLDLDKSSRDTAINVYTGIMIAKTYIDRLDEPQAEKVEAHLAEHWSEDVGDCLWWNFPVEEPPYCGTPLDEHFPKYKTHFTTIDMPNEIEKPKRWVVKHKDDCIYFEKFDEDKYDFSAIWTYLAEPPAFKFTDRTQAEAVATLVDGSVEEV